MATVQSYKQLVAWQKAMELVLCVYRFTQTFPKSEIYGLVPQMRRSAVSVPSNIAEGQGRASTGEFRQFLGNAKGSLFEVETQATIARQLSYLDEQQFEQLSEKINEVGRLISGLLNSLERKAKAAAAGTSH